MASYTAQTKGLSVRFSSGRAVFRDGKADVPASVAKDLDAFAARHPEYGIERVDEEVGEAGPRPGSKAALVEQARALGLDPRGSKAALEKRIAEHLAAAEEPDGSDEDADGDEAGEESHESDEESGDANDEESGEDSTDE